MGRLEEAKKEKDGKSKREKEALASYDLPLFEALRKKRKELADQASLPPFTIFHDRTLKEMAARMPKTRDELAGIYGIGAVKLRKYGDVFLRIIKQYRETCQITEQPKASGKRSVH